MRKKNYTLLITLMLVFASALAQKNVIFVLRTELVYLDQEVSISIDSYDDGNVFSVTEQDIAYVTDENLDALNEADLIIMGRSVNSSTVVHDTWDKITAPVMYSSPWVVRGDRAGMFNVSTSSNFEDSTTVLEGIILDPGDPVFEGISATTITWWTGRCSALGAVPSGSQDKGILVETAENVPLFGRFAAGEEFFTGSGRTPLGPRSYMGNGFDNPTITSNYWGWSEDALTIYFRELKRMAGVEDEPINISKTLANSSALSVINTNGVIAVSMDGLTGAEIYSIDGKLITSKNQAEDKIEFSNLKKGIYIVKAVVDGSVLTRKFLVK